MRALTFAAVLMLAGCGTKESVRVEQKGPATLVAVSTTVAARSTIPLNYDATGTVRARVSATVSAKLMGYAKEVRAAIGDHVDEGQTLVVLDSRDQEAAIRQAEAAREEVRSATPEAESAIVAAKVQVELAQVTFGRMQDLLNKRSVTQQEFDDVSARLKAAQAALDMARARRAQLDAKLVQADQAVRTAGIQQAYTTVTAPFSGVILMKSIEPGTLVVPGATLFSMERDGSFRFEADVEESRLRSVRVGQELAVTIDDRHVQGRVSEIVPVVDATSRTGIVKIDLPNMQSLRSGLFGRASFGGGEREALLIPKSAVVERGQLQSVFVIENRIARVRLVTTGATASDRIEVLSGLSDGETVVSPIPAGLQDGGLVEVRP
jgi:membrane fusion protein, multidrug efflux system